MKVAVAALDFLFPIHRYDEKEKDKSKIASFNKGDKIPSNLLWMLERWLSHYVEYVGNEDKKEEKKPEEITKQEVDWRKFNKSKLDKYAEKEYNIKLDKRQSLENMQIAFEKELNK